MSSPTSAILYFLILARHGNRLFRFSTELAHSRFGRALRAISQDEDAARACGISIIRYKSKCFLVAAFTAGIAGSLYAHHARYLNPNDFTFNKSIEILIMVVVGGLGSLPGAVVGAIIIVLMPENSSARRASGSPFFSAH